MALTHFSKASRKRSSNMKSLLLLGIIFSAFQISFSETPAFCGLPSDPGQGDQFSFAVYYDAVEDHCSPFFYNGQGGNANRFVSERDCMRNCSPNAETYYPVDATTACHFKYTPGKCNGHYLRYYYDSARDKCKRFIWTGCKGNGNRFFDSQSCNATCAGIHDDGGDPEEDEPDTPIAIICGVLLAVIVSAIIITVAVLTVKSKKKKEKKKAKTSKPSTETPLQEGGIEMT